MHVQGNTCKLNNELYMQKICDTFFGKLLTLFRETRNKEGLIKGITIVATVDPQRLAIIGKNMAFLLEISRIHTGFL